MFRLFLFIFGIMFATLAKAHDLKHLPLGDNLKSEEPKAGYIWPCHIEANAGGAFKDGPWLNDDGKTWDSTKKVIVQGDVKWPHTFTITVEGDRRVFTTNDLPEHGTGVFPIAEESEAYKYDHNPNRIKKQSFSFSLPANPQLAPKPGCTPGAVGIMLSGVSLFSAIDAPGRDAPAHEAQDSCNGHPQITGAYHYHSLSGCIEDKHHAKEHSALLGYAVDGYGIYGMAGEGGKILDSKVLDECHGHAHEIMWDGKQAEMFHYHATADFPYTVGCMRGTYDFKVMQVLSGPRPGWFDFFFNSDQSELEFKAMNKHSRVWSLQDAKAKFSEVVRLAQTEGPQVVTVHGREAVTITKSNTHPKIKPGMSALEALNLIQSGPPIDFDIPVREAGGEFKDPQL